MAQANCVKNAKLRNLCILAISFAILSVHAKAASPQPFLFLNTPTAYSTGGFPNSVLLADVNGDGKLDLLAANCSDQSCFGEGSIAVLLGNGDGTFQPAVTYDSGGLGAFSVAVADVNGDGKPDILAANCGTQFNCSGGGVVGVFLGNGDGTFQPVVTYPSGGFFAQSISAADLNGDGNLDLVVANSARVLGGQSIGVLLGNGDGTFQAAATYQLTGLGAQSVVVADVNKDGIPDLVVAECGSSVTQSCDSGNGQVDILLGNGDGTFSDSAGYSTGGLYGHGAAVADVNGDGKLDIITANAFSCNSGVLIANGDGTFQPVVTYNTCGLDPVGGAASVAISDVNGDGKLDLVFSGDGLSVLLGKGNGTFQPVTQYGPGLGGVLSVVAGDLNGDGKPDIASIGGGAASGDAVIFLNNSGAPSTVTTLASNANPIPLNQSLTYTATITPPAGKTLKGNVEFLDGPVMIGMVSLASNKASLTIAQPVLGPHVISAIYSGDLHVAAGSAASTLTQYVQALTTTLLSTSGSPSQEGQPVTFTARVKSQNGAIPNGDLVAFYDGATLLGNGVLSGGIATLTTSSLSAMAHSIHATYVGDNAFASSTRSLRQIVIGYASSTSLTSTLNPAAYGQSVTFTAKLTTVGPKTPTGLVKFVSNGSALGSSLLDVNGVATLTKAKLNVGTFAITAIYAGDSFNAASTSPVLNQVVTPAATSATLTSSPNPSVSGQTITFTATITSPTVKPTGPVTFMAGGSVLGTAQLSAGKAKFQTSSLPVGTTGVTAKYAGNSNITAASASVSQVVQQ